MCCSKRDWLRTMRVEKRFKVNYLMGARKRRGTQIPRKKKISGEISEDFKEHEETLEFIEKLNKGGRDMNDLTKEAMHILSRERKYSHPAKRLYREFC